MNKYWYPYLTGKSDQDDVVFLNWVDGDVLERPTRPADDHRAAGFRPHAA